MFEITKRKIGTGVPGDFVVIAHNIRSINSSQIVERSVREASFSTLLDQGSIFSFQNGLSRFVQLEFCDDDI